MTRVALIHAVRVAIDPVAEAFARLWPEAECMNLLDDSLSKDHARAGRLTDSMVSRFVRMTRYAHDTGADGILFTCSAFGPAIEAAAIEVPIPVLKPNEAMFMQALRAKRPGLLASFAPSVAPMTEEFAALSDTPLVTACAPEAMAALNAGDGDRHDALLVAAAQALSGCDLIMLAQFSTARARDAVSRAVDLPVLTSPDSAVTALKARLAEGPVTSR